MAARAVATVLFCVVFALTILAGRDLLSALEPASSPDLAYTVVEGDSLSALALRFDVDSDEIATASGLDRRELVMVGEVLIIPGRATMALPPSIAENAERRSLAPRFDLWAAEYDVDPVLVKSVGYVESGWQRDVVSPVGAMGIGQLMPVTVKHLSELLGTDVDPFDADENIRGMTRYLAFLLAETGGDVDKALAGYYQGLAGVERDGVGAPTERYIANVRAAADLFGHRN